MEKMSNDVQKTPRELQMEKEYYDSIFRAAVVNYNEIHEKRGAPEWKFPLSESTTFDLKISDRGINNRLAISVVNTEIEPAMEDKKDDQSLIHIAHYDPAVQKFLFYPELVIKEDVDSLQERAKELRATAVKTLMEYDYDAEIIADLHKKHKEVLGSDGLIFKVIERFNTLPSHEKPQGLKEIHIDPATTFFVCLTPSEKNVEGVAVDLFPRDEVCLSICINGYLFKDNGVMRRKMSDILPLGMRDPNNMEGKFDHNLDIVLMKEFEKLLSLINEMQELRVTFYKNIDVHKLALKK